ncbi:MAG: hypothetical protein ACOC1F_10355, partial [Myxococcota bacterium]
MPNDDYDPQVALEEKRAELEAMPASEVDKPPYPPDRMVGEANALYKVADRYRKELKEVNLDEALIDDLPRRTQALAGAQAARALVPDTKRSAEELKAEAKAFEIRNDIYTAGRYATRKIAKAQQALDAMSDGTGHDDLIQDLKDGALFSQTYAAEFARVGQDPEGLAKQALASAEAFEGYLAERRAATTAETKATDLRNRAATHLYDAMSEIRGAGAFRFRRDADVLPL